MTKLLSSIVILLFAVKGFSQRESVYLDFDKYSCRAGDTVWFKGVIFKGLYPSIASTNLYVELISKEGVVFQRHSFPIVRGQCVGQLILPDTLATDNYYVVALTKQQLNYDSLHFFSVPVLVYNKERPSGINHKRQWSNLDPVAVGSIKGVTWITTPWKEKLLSMLAADSGSFLRQLHIVTALSGDSLLRADIELDSAHRQKYIELPVAFGQERAVLLLYEDSVMIGRQILHWKDNPKIIKLNVDTFDAAPLGYNSWEVKISDSTIFLASISVTDADRSVSAPVTIECLEESHTENLTVRESLMDTSFIRYTGKATRESGKGIKDPFSREIFVAGVRDSNYLFTKLMKIDDAGEFMLDSLFFFGNIDLQFQINKDNDERTKDVKLTFDRFVPPMVDSNYFKILWEDDSIPIGNTDTFFTQKELSTYALSKMKLLKTVVVKATPNFRKELDDRYATGIFSELTPYSFDIRTDKSVHTIWEYLRKNLPGFNGGPDIGRTPTFHGEPLLFYVDNHPQSLDDVEDCWYEEIAYIKVFSSLWIDETPFMKWKTGYIGFTLSDRGGGLKVPIQKDPPVICIYTRKGVDIRTGGRG